LPKAIVEVVPKRKKQKTITAAIGHPDRGAQVVEVKQPLKRGRRKKK